MSANGYLDSAVLRLFFRDDFDAGEALELLLVVELIEVRR